MEQLSLNQSKYTEDSDQESLRKHVYGGNPKVFARFYVGAERMPEDDADGAPVFREKVCVHIQVPDENTGRILNAITRDLEDDDQKKYPREWDLFVSSSNRHSIPLTALPQMRPNIAKAFEALDIRSVQDLVAKEVPGYLNKWKPWASWVMALHQNAETGTKPRIKLAA